MLSRLRPTFSQLVSHNSRIFLSHTHFTEMGKRAHSEERNATTESHKAKKLHLQSNQVYSKIATAENAAAVDENPPLWILLDAVKTGPSNLKRGDSIVYWMRMEDMRGSLDFNVVYAG